MEYKKLEEKFDSYGEKWKRQGIEIERFRKMKLSEDLEVWVTNKTNGQVGFFIVYKKRIGYDDWYFWCPSDQQMKLFPILIEIFDKIDKHNEGSK